MVNKKTQIEDHDRKKCCPLVNKEKQLSFSFIMELIFSALIFWSLWIFMRIAFWKKKTAYLWCLLIVCKYRFTCAYWVLSIYIAGWTNIDRSICAFHGLFNRIARDEFQPKWSLHMAQWSNVLSAGQANVVLISYSRLIFLSLYKKNIHTACIILYRWLQQICVSESQVYTINEYRSRDCNRIWIKENDWPHISRSQLSVCSIGDGRIVWKIFIISKCRLLCNCIFGVLFIRNHLHIFRS